MNEWMNSLHVESYVSGWNKIYLFNYYNSLQLFIYTWLIFAAFPTIDSSVDNSCTAFEFGNYKDFKPDAATEAQTDQIYIKSSDTAINHTTQQL